MKRELFTDLSVTEQESLSGGRDYDEYGRYFEWKKDKWGNWYKWYPSNNFGHGGGFSSGGGYY